MNQQTNLSFKHSSGSSYIQTSPITLNPLILDIKTMHMSFVGKFGKSSDIVCVFEKEDYEKILHLIVALAEQNLLT